MELKEFYKMQDELDKYIIENSFGTGVFEVHNHKVFLNDRLLALMVEVGELANATRCFKYWSVKDSESRERLLDEYSDVFHFFLSVGNILFTPKEIEKGYLEKYKVNIQRQKEGY